MNAFKRLVHMPARPQLRPTCVSCWQTARFASRTWKTIRGCKMPTVYVVCRKFTVQCVRQSHTRERLWKLKVAVRLTIHLSFPRLVKCCRAATFTALHSHLFLTT